MKITNILNPLTGGASTEKYEWVKDKSLAGYTGYLGECVVTCNGESIELPTSEIFPADGEEYMMMPIPTGGDRETWRTMGLMTMAAITLGASLPGAPILLAKYGRITAFVGSMLISIFLKDKDKSVDTSESYQWRHKDSPTAAHGSPMPIIYGKARIRPIMKNRYIKIEGDKQRLYALYGIATHKVDVRTGLPTIVNAAAGELSYGDEFTWDEISGATFFYPFNYANRGDAKTYPYAYGTAAFYDGVIINGRAIEDFNADVEWETRPGLPEQFIITGFEATYANYVSGVSLFGDAPVIDKGEAGMGIDIALNLLFWKGHNLSHNGSVYPIVNFRGIRREYIHWKSPNKFYTTSDSASLSGYYLIASIIDDEPVLNRTLIPSTTSSDWINPVTVLTGIHDIELIFHFPFGLYGHTPEGNLRDGQCALFAQYREVDTSAWINFDFVFAKNVDEADKRESVHRGVVRRKTTVAFSVSVNAIPGSAEYLDLGKNYEIRVLAYTSTIVELANVATIVYGEENADGKRPGFTYPGEPLLGIKALASGQISGDLDVQVDVERSKVWVYNTRHVTDRDGNPSDGRWVEGVANNHAWAVYDILAQGHPDHPAYPTVGNDDAEAIYGCGINKDRLDYESFREWADNLQGEDSLDYELNIVFDTFMTAWDAILRICQEGRGMVYPVGTKIYAFTDKAADATQLFTMGNIHIDTFVQKYTETSQKINIIEVNYYDEERNYEKTTLAVRTADWDSSESPSVPITITLYGTTTFNQAWSIARFMLMGNELLNNVITFGVDVDALAAQAGDVVEVQHDVLNAGRGGRIVNYEENPVSNPSFETNFNSWTNWGTATRSISTVTKYSGDKSYLHSSANLNAGVSQLITGLNESTEYTLSCYIYPTIDTSLRIMTFTDAYYSTHPAGLNAWERLELTVTTQPGQTTLTVWLGGDGAAYFDAVQVEAVAEATAWMQQSRVTLDRDITLGATGSYELIAWRAGTRISKSTALNLGETRDNLLYSTAWDTPPQKYDPYSFGVSSSIVEKYRITDISRTSELMRTLTLVQYDEALYDSYSPADSSPLFDDGQFTLSKIAPPDTTVETLANLLNLASNVQLQEIISRNRLTGQYESSVVVTWDPASNDPRAAWEVWFRDVDASDNNWQGEWVRKEYSQDEKVEDDGYAFISLEDDNASKPFFR